MFSEDFYSNLSPKIKLIDMCHVWITPVFQVLKNSSKLVDNPVITLYYNIYKNKNANVVVGGDFNCGDIE